MRLLDLLAASRAHYVFIEKRLLHRLISKLDASRNSHAEWWRRASDLQPRTEVVVFRLGQRLLHWRGRHICILRHFYVRLSDL